MNSKSCELTLAGKQYYPWVDKCAFEMNSPCDNRGANFLLIDLLAKLINCTIKNVIEFNSIEEYTNAILNGQADMAINLGDYYAIKGLPLAQISHSIAFYDGLFLTGNMPKRYTTPFWYLKPYRPETWACITVILIIFGVIIATHKSSMDVFG